MATLAKSFSTLIVLALTAYLSMAQPASAISVELAKKCRAMAIKAHPTQIAGTKQTGIQRWSQFPGQFGGLAKVDSGLD